MTNAEQAADWVREGQSVGLGTGRAATQFIEALAVRVRHGLGVRGVATSDSAAEAARNAGLPLTTLEEAGQIDLTVDGADEVDPQLDLIKGYGGALVREKIVAAASKQVIILIEEQKLVPQLGQRGKLPIEVVPFAAGFCRSRLASLGHASSLRGDGDAPFVTDNGNFILDLQVSLITDAAFLDQTLSAIPGVVGTGLFLGLTNLVLVQAGNQVRHLRRAR